jgi:hypothetical protein
MSDQDRDYAAIRRSVETNVSRQRWLYRLTFFLAHLIFYAVTMLAVWGTIGADSQLRAILFESGSRAAVVVLLPTILWAAVILFHAASLFFESGAGEKVIREQLLRREVGEEIMRRGRIAEELLEKPKRRATAVEAEHRLWSDDSGIDPVDEDEYLEQRGYNARSNRTGSSQEAL